MVLTTIFHNPYGALLLWFPAVSSKPGIACWQGHGGARKVMTVSFLNGCFTEIQEIGQPNFLEYHRVPSHAQTYTKETRREQKRPCCFVSCWCSLRT
jgi:hypothetical protein